jgi:hypothetical protein
MNGMKPSHLRTPRTLSEGSFQEGYKGGISSESGNLETSKSWILILVIFLVLFLLASLSFS